MRLLEHQSKSLFARHGLPIPEGRVAVTSKEARRFAEELGGAVVVKAQVLIGGRGKAGGIRLAHTPAEAEDIAAALLDMEIRGYPVRELLIEQAVDIGQEIYLGIVIDRGARRAVMMVSAEGGVEIEQVAHERPEAIHKVAIDPLTGLSGEQTAALAQSLGLPQSLYDAFDGVARALYEVLVDNDATLAEINPLVITGAGALLALDGKMVVDDNALFRHPDLSKWQADDDTDVTSSAAEREAREAGLSYVHLGGEIGCVVNGAGLAMATMDVIKLFGGVPANFLDVGGGAGPERVATALRLVLASPGIKAVLINIFGGITLCDEVARGIVTALEQIQGMEQVYPTVPMVVRLVGTNEEQGHEILNASGQRLIVAQTLAEAARTVVAVAAGEIEG